MRRIIILALLTTGCASMGDKTPDVAQQNAIILDAMVNYIGGLQTIGFLPKPEELESKLKEVTTK